MDQGPQMATLVRTGKSYFDDDAQSDTLLQDVVTGGTDRVLLPVRTNVSFCWS